MSNLTSSPESSDDNKAASHFGHLKALVGNSPEKPKFRAATIGDTDEDEDITEGRPFRSMELSSGAFPEESTRAGFKAVVLPSYESSPEKPARAGFKLNTLVSDLILNKTLAGSDEALATGNSALGALGIDKDTILEGRRSRSSSPESAPLDTRCPMCDKPVTKEFLHEYSKGKRMNVREQTRFCQAHQKNSARSEWETHGFPTIEWETLDERIAEHHNFIKSILDGASSHYRDVMEEDVKRGKNRTLKQGIDSGNSALVSGYYGSRGFRAISENIMQAFAPQLRTRAVKDRLIAARGVPAFVQAVLVPEVALLLIQEDMQVECGRAREILRESTALGNLLNEELEDVVVRRNSVDHSDEYED